MENLNIAIITGMSGAGKTVVAQSFEDMGFYTVDNMPPKIIPNFLDLIKETPDIDKVAMIIDLRAKDFFDELENFIVDEKLKGNDSLHVIYLEADERELVSRYKESRRSHPLSTQGRVMDGIILEKELLVSIRERADIIIDTTHSTPRELREKIISEFNVNSAETFHVDVMSFGFKYGLPIDADIVLDVRFLPNPYYIEALRAHTGLDKAVYQYVMAQADTETFYQKVTDLLAFLLPRYKQEGKTNLTIAIGCTGGKHRSVALAERINHFITEQGFLSKAQHRDMEKKKESSVRS